MLLDRLLENLQLRVEPFARCDVRQGWQLKLKPAQSAVLHFVLAGRGSLHTPNAPCQRLGPDTLAVVPPGKAHWVESATATERVFEADSSKIGSGEVAEVVAGDGECGVVLACGRIVASYGGAVGLFDHLADPLVIDLTGSPVVRSAFAALIDERERARPGAVAMTAALMSQCFVEMLRRLCETGECRLPWLAALEDERLARVLDAILSEPGNPHTLESLAGLAGMSRTVFTQRFQQAFGRSAAEILRDERLRRSAELLRNTDLPMKTVASRVGFSSRSHFSRAFHEKYGVSPGVFRDAPA